MSPVVQVSLLLLAGVAAGLAGTIAGLASLFSYPALLAVGLPATAANVTNTVSLAVSTVGAVARSRPELAGQARVAHPLGCSARRVGCWARAWADQPGRGVERVAPPLIAGASAALLGLANLVAAVAFAVWGPVSWSAVLPLTARGCCGAWSGPAVARRLPAEALRVGIGLAGLGLAATLGWDAYSG